MEPWILIEMMAEQRLREGERGAERVLTSPAAKPASPGAFRSWLARTLYTAATCLDQGVAGSGGARTAGRAA